MKREGITVEYARQKLGKKGKRMTDKEIEDYLNFLRRLCNKAIDSVINQYE